MNLKSKKTWIIIGVAVAVIAIGVIAFKYLGKTEADKTLAEAPPVDAEDQATVDKMVALCKKHIPDGIGWLAPLVRDAMESGDIDPDYKLNGTRITKAGTMLAIYARAYYGYGYEYKGINEADFNQQMYNLYYAYANNKVAI